MERLRNATYILIVPLGPRLDLRTSWSPLAALMLIPRAAALRTISACALKSCRDDIFKDLKM